MPDLRVSAAMRCHPDWREEQVVMAPTACRLCLWSFSGGEIPTCLKFGVPNKKGAPKGDKRFIYAEWNVCRPCRDRKGGLKKKGRLSPALSYDVTAYPRLWQSVASAAP